MAKRTTFFLGEELPDAMQEALGFANPSVLIETMKSLEITLPKLDWDRLTVDGLSEINDQTKEEISSWFELEFYWRLKNETRKAIEIGRNRRDISNSEFSKIATNIEKKAKELATQLDELAEHSSLMLVRPYSKNWITNFDKQRDIQGRFSFRAEEPTEDDFADYLAFRNMLDYYSNFTGTHSLFSDYVGRRYQTQSDYNWYETFVRRVVLALWSTNFDLTITIPTDTNPSYESTVVRFLYEIKDQFTENKNAHPSFSDIDLPFSYRQHANLILKLKKEFEKSEIFWAQVRLMQAERD